MNINSPQNPLIQNRIIRPMTPPVLREASKTEAAPALPQESAQISSGASAPIAETGTTAGTSAAKPSSSWLQSIADSVHQAAHSLVIGPANIAISAVKDVIGGGVRNSHFEHSVEYANEEKAKESFDSAKERLMNPNEWKELGPGLGPTNFRLYDGKEKKEKEGAPSEGDYLRIKLPDPGPPVWVKIEEISSDDDSAKVVVRPSENPTSNSPTVIHLFDEQTTNTFQVKREGQKVTSSVSGDNEMSNQDGNLLQRSFAGARTAGAWMGAKVPQWNAFTKKIIEGPGPKAGQRLTGAFSGLMTSLSALQMGRGDR